MNDSFVQAPFWTSAFVHLNHIHLNHIQYESLINYSLKKKFKINEIYRVLEERHAAEMVKYIA